MMEPKKTDFYFFASLHNIISILLCSFCLLASSDIFSACGRMATVNYQQILVDIHSHHKGEGLRFFLNKDPIAKSYLDEYQEKSRPHWYQAATGTLGTGIFIFGLSQSEKNQNQGFTTKKTLMISGLLLITLNILIYKTMEHNNERLLIQAIEEYNKRNLPRIYFSPFPNNEENSWKNSHITPVIGVTHQF